MNQSAPKNTESVNVPENASAGRTQNDGPTPQEMSVLADLYSQGRVKEGEIFARTLIARFPFHGFAWQALGSILKRQGRMSEATVALRRAAELLPADAEASNNLGVILKEQGKLAEAEASYSRALRINPDYALAHNNLANIRKEQGRFVEAAACYRRALEINAYLAEAHNNLGVIYRNWGQFAEAVTCYENAIKIKPGYVDAYCNLGITLYGQGRLDEAENIFQRALQIKPDFADAYFHLGSVFRKQGRLSESEESYRRALKGKPDFVDAYLSLADLFKKQGRLSEAEGNYRQALAINSRCAEAHNNLGSMYVEQGRLDEARRCFESAMAADPASVIPHCNMCLLKTYSEGDPHVAFLERQIHEIETLPEQARSSYWFALGKAREDLGRYDAAYAAYAEGNRLKHASHPYDDAAADVLLERLLSIFTKDFFASRVQPASSSSSAKTPIFIVGMPRSGTTLLEQILASYPGIYGAGELSDVQEVVMSAVPGGLTAQFSGLSAEDFKRMGEQYIQRVWQHSPSAARIVDKLPSNFFFLGMIHLMLPNAKIIHAMRDPMDSCFSCYARLFDETMGFAYDLDTVGRYYVRYMKLMRHWHAVLPANTIFDLRYEDIVNDTEGEARRMLEYLGLPWDDRCLAFHQNNRLIKTASTVQVRQPIYKTSVARWKRFEKQLAPLLDIVKDYRD